MTINDKYSLTHLDCSGVTSSKLLVYSGGLAQMVERSLSMREVPGSSIYYISFFFHSLNLVPRF